MISLADFLSRDCRIGDHEGCPGLWSGLGILVTCNCKCGHKEMESEGVVFKKEESDDRNGTEQEKLSTLARLAPRVQMTPSDCIKR